MAATSSTQSILRGRPLPGNKEDDSSLTPHPLNASQHMLLIYSINSHIYLPPPPRLSVSVSAVLGGHPFNPPLTPSHFITSSQGQLCSVVTCNECGSISRTYDPFTSLSLPLATHHDITVTVTVLRHMPRLSTAALAELWHQHQHQHQHREALGKKGQGQDKLLDKGSNQGSDKGQGQHQGQGKGLDKEKEKAAFIEMILARHAEASRPLRLCVVLPRLAGRWVGRWVGK